jgi:hypothetical protein
MYSSDTFQFIENGEEEDFVSRITKEKPKSFVIVRGDKKIKNFYIANSSGTLAKEQNLYFLTFRVFN